MSQGLFSLGVVTDVYFGMDRGFDEKSLGGLLWKQLGEGESHPLFLGKPANGRPRR